MIYPADIYYILLGSKSFSDFQKIHLIIYIDFH